MSNIQDDTDPTPDTSPGDELTADEILRRFRQHCVHGIMSDTPWTMDFVEAKDRLNRLMLTRERAARIDELKYWQWKTDGHIELSGKEVDERIKAIDAQLNKEEK